VQLVSKISYLCDPDPPLSQTDGRTTCHRNTALCTSASRGKKKDWTVRKWQQSLCRHYISCGKSHRKECLKRKALRQTEKTDIEAAYVTCWCRLFHVRAAATWKARSTTVVAI